MPEKNPFYGATFAERKAARLKAEGKPADDAKAVSAEDGEVEDKAVGAAQTKKRPARRK